MLVWGGKYLALSCSWYLLLNILFYSIVRSVITLAMGFIKSFEGLLAARLLLG